MKPIGNGIFLMYIFLEIYITIAVELYNWHIKTTNENKLIKKTKL